MKLEHFDVYFDAREDESSTPLKDSLIEKLYHESTAPRSGTINSILRAIEQYPDTPQFYNFLYTAYRILGDTKNAEITARRTFEFFPDYLFARMAMAEVAFDINHLHLVPKLLGPGMELHELYPEKTAFHSSEVKAFYYNAALYYLHLNDFYQAEKRFSILKTLFPDEKAIREMGKKMLATKIEYRAKIEQDDLAKRLRTVTAFPTVVYPPASERAKFDIPEIQLFYSIPDQKSPKKIIEQLIKYTKQQLTPDLLKVFKDTITRYEYFQENYEEWEENEMSFPTHAAYWAGALEADECLPVILDLFRQGEEILDYWFADAYHNIFTPVIFSIGHGSLPILQQFMLEPNVYNASKTCITDAVGQMYQHYEEMRPACIQWFHEVTDAFINAIGNEHLIDSIVLSNIIHNLIKMHLPEFLPKIKVLMDADIVPHSHVGDYNAIRAKLEKPWGEWEKDPMPEHIREYYDLSYKSRRVPPPDDDEMDTNFEMIQYNLGLLAEMLDSDKKGKHNYPVKPVKSKAENIYSGVSRNAPCPCGSGKKFKRCHGAE